MYTDKVVGLEDTGRRLGSGCDSRTLLSQTHTHRVLSTHMGQFTQATAEVPAIETMRSTI